MSHASKRIIALRELGKATYSAMRSDYCYNAAASALEPDTALTLTRWDKEHADLTPDERLSDLRLSTDHVGVPRGEAYDMLDWIDVMWPAPARRLDVNHLWYLTAGSFDMCGVPRPVPDWFRAGENPPAGWDDDEADE